MEVLAIKLEGGALGSNESLSLLAHRRRRGARGKESSNGNVAAHLDSPKWLAKTSSMNSLDRSQLHTADFPFVLLEIIGQVHA